MKKYRMLSREGAWAVPATLLLTSLGLLTSTNALAQDSEEGAFSSEGLGPSTGDTEAAPSEPASPPAEEPAQPETAVSASVSTSGEADAEAAPQAAPASPEVSEAAKDAVPAGEPPKPPPLALEVLPATAYPSQPLPGIRGGSLAFVMSGLQWPYMPSYGPDQPKLRIGISGSSWADFNYRAVRPGLDILPDTSETRVQGRLTLRITPVYNFKNGYFGQSRIEFVGITEQQHIAGQYVDLDEAWVRLGKWNAFDVTVGRTQGFEIYHFGMGLDINTQEREGARSLQGVTVQQPYALTELWDRGVNNGAVALHWHTPQWLRLELLGRMGVAGDGNDVGVRPAGIIDLGWLKLKGGYEFRSQFASATTDPTRTETKGFGGSVNFVFDPWVEFGVGAAQRVLDRWINTGAFDEIASSTTTTYGGFVNVRPYFKDWMVGLGYHRTDWQNFNYDAFGYAENQVHEQMFGAVQYQLWDNFFFKYVLAYSKVHIEQRNDSNPEDSGYENQQISHRLRVMMLF